MKKLINKQILSILEEAIDNNPELDFQDILHMYKINDGKESSIDTWTKIIHNSRFIITN